MGDGPDGHGGSDLRPRNTLDDIIAVTIKSVLALQDQILSKK
jgi:hypothetical protein